MNNNASTPRTPTHLRVKIDDTELDSNDYASDGPAVVFLNGAFSSQKDWTQVIQMLGAAYHTVTYDERGRGKSATSSNYRFATYEEDLKAIIQATHVQKPILVGWSLGAAIAVRYAANHPNEIAALVLIDGAYPISSFDEAGKAKVRKQFHSMRWFLPILAWFGKAGRMSAAQAAEINIELDEQLGTFQGDFAKLTIPVHFICATGRSAGGTEEEFAKMRASLDPLAAQYKNISVQTLPCNHLQIISKYPEAIVEAIKQCRAPAGKQAQ